MTEISDDDIPFVFKLGRAGVGGLFMDDGVISIIIMYGCVCFFVCLFVCM